MSEHDLPELDPELRALLAVESDPLDPPDGAFERVFERVGQTLLNPPPSDGGSDPTGGGDPSSSPAPSSAPGAEAALTQATVTTTTTAAVTTAATATVSLPTAAALAFVLGLGAGIVGTRVATPEPEVRVEERVVERVVEVPVRVVETVYVRADAGLDGVDEAAPTGGPTHASGPSADAGVTGVTGTDEAGSGRDRDLADENALVSRAQAALARGRTSEALAATSEHQRRFPRGEFVEEREALAIQALARSGNLPAATARAERFRTRYPRSMLLRAVNAAVGGTGSPSPSPAPTPSPSDSEDPP